MGQPVDYAPEAVARRLRQVDQLRALCLALAGPRLKWNWRKQCDAKTSNREEPQSKKT